MTTTCENCKNCSQYSTISYLMDDYKEKTINVENVLKLSDEHPVPFPIETARLKTLLKTYPWSIELQQKHNKQFNKDLVKKYINSTYPIIHEKLVPLIVSFIRLKKKSSQKVERKYYNTVTPRSLITKLMHNRPMTFVGPHDKYLLEDETFGAGDNFEKIGKDSTKNPDFSLHKLNSYDEMKIAALLSVSGWSHFINNGSRRNNGKYGDGKDHELQGVIMGQVGPRFQKSNVMDFQDFVLSEQQNTKQNGYGKDGEGERTLILKMWANLWGLEYFPTYDQKSERLYDSIPSRPMHLDRELYKQRIRMMADVLLIDANHRAKEQNMKAYVHVVGLGLGVWQIGPTQTELYMDAFGDSIDELLSNGVIENVSFVDFSWIKATEVKGVTSDQKFPGSDLTVKFSSRNLHDPVPEGHILVCNFAWDSNSSPGNEYWSGSLCASGDPAAACSSGVAELHNGRINPRTRGEYCRVACVKRGVVTLQEYVRSLHEEQGVVEEEHTEEEDTKGGALDNMGRRINQAFHRK